MGYLTGVKSAVGILTVFLKIMYTIASKGAMGAPPYGADKMSKVLIKLQGARLPPPHP